jgi:hypothetical protein
LSRIILARPTLSAITDATLGNGPLISSRANLTAAMIEAEMQRADANLYLSRRSSS